MTKFNHMCQEHHSYTVARDSFLAHLGSVLWGSMRHVIAPSVSHRAHHYYDKLSFQLYFVTQEVSSRGNFYVAYILIQYSYLSHFLTLCRKSGT